MENIENIIGVIVWIMLIIYTDWKIYKTNYHYLKNNSSDDFRLSKSDEYKDEYETRIIRNIFSVFYPVILFVCILSNGLKVLRNDYNLSGEKINK
jgi:hypothetical protein